MTEGKFDLPIPSQRYLLFDSFLYNISRGDILTVSTHPILSSIKGENFEQHFVYDNAECQFSPQNLYKRVEKWCDLHFSSAKQKIIQTKLNSQKTFKMKSEIHW